MIFSCDLADLRSLHQCEARKHTTQSHQIYIDEGYVLLESNKIQICKSTSLFTPNYQDFWQSQIFMCTQGKK